LHFKVLLKMKYFVSQDSILREVWGKSDTVLFIFAGASAEFALNKAVDWLYFTGRLPADPLGRLFSTVAYAGKIIYLPYEEALAAIEQINAAHQYIENQRGKNIPQWSYRDVLYMLIDYSIRAYELLERELERSEKEEIFDVFRRVGIRMHIRDLPETYDQWLPERQQHLERDLIKSEFTVDLYRQYRKHLGPVRYWFLLQVQQLECPQKVKDLLGLKRNLLIPPALQAYKISRSLNADEFLKALLLPTAYKEQIKDLDRY
jgi:hypothetical protein